MNASQNPLEVVNVENIVQLLSILNNTNGEVVPSTLKYIELCITKCENVLIDDNAIMYMNSLLEKYKGKFDGTQFVLAEEIEDRAEDVKQSLLAIYAFLEDTGLFEGDDEFWAGCKEEKC